jgi:predicted O-methyltransferase YrrM
MSMRGAYVRAWHGVGSVLDCTGIDGWLARRQHPVAHHLRSFAAIHDVERMISLDVPWWTYPAAADVDAFLAARDGKARVFEYGAGASTVWLAKRAGEVHSVEHDAAFVELLRPALGGIDHVHLHCVVPTERTADSTAISERDGHEHLDFADYVAVIDEVGGDFDLVVVDGRARPSCLARAVPHLAEDGVIAFDNAGRARYRAAIEASGLVVDVRRGWAPSLPYREATALLRRPGWSGS